ncbi:MAG: SIMPL domain-containing protein [Clostridiales bacterium]|nr:SIMPL domain-containing protein [Clostridiales bacterium]
MKKIIGGMTVLCLSALLSGSVFAAEPVKDSITVAGKGIVEVMPDKADISMSISTYDKDSSVAAGKNGEIFQRVKEKLMQSGIKNEDIKTNYYRVNPEYDSKSEENKITGYNAFLSFTVTTNDIDHVRDYIDIALKEGVTESNRVDFGLEEPEKYYADALKASIGNAQKSAEALAEALGKSKIIPYSVNEHGDGNAYEISNMASSSMAKEEAADSEAGSPKIGYDNIQIEANVSVTYLYQ